MVLDINIRTFLFHLIEVRVWHNLEQEAHDTIGEC